MPRVPRVQRRITNSHVWGIGPNSLRILRILALGLGLLCLGALGSQSVLAEEVGESRVSQLIAKATLEDARALRECMSCHMFTREELANQGRLARKKHKRVLSGKKVCIDCHESEEMCCHETVFARVELVPLEPFSSVRAILKGK